MAGKPRAFLLDLLDLSLRPAGGQNCVLVLEGLVGCDGPAKTHGLCASLLTTPVNLLKTIYGTASVQQRKDPLFPLAAARIVLFLPYPGKGREPVSGAN